MFRRKQHANMRSNYASNKPSYSLQYFEEGFVLKKVTSIFRIETP